MDYWYIADMMHFPFLFFTFDSHFFDNTPFLPVHSFMFLTHGLLLMCVLGVDSESSANPMECSLQV